MMALSYAAKARETCEETDLFWRIVEKMLQFFEFDDTIKVVCGYVRRHTLRCQYMTKTSPL